MEGKIVKINYPRSMAAIQTSKGFSIFEILSPGELDEGDEVEWKDELLIGETMLINRAKKSSLRILFQHHRVPAHHVPTKLKL